MSKADRRPRGSCQSFALPHIPLGRGAAVVAVSLVALYHAHIFFRSTEGTLHTKQESSSAGVSWQRPAEDWDAHPALNITFSVIQDLLNTEYQPTNVLAAVQRFLEVPILQNSTADASLIDRVTPALLAIREAGQVLSCGLDHSLLTSSHVPRGEILMFGANLRNNADLMPHYLLQLLALVCLRPLGTLSVSLYESGSSDGTGAWLAAVAGWMSVLRVPHRIIANGSLVQASGQPRIEFLASVRNAVLDPLHGNISNTTEPYTWQHGHLPWRPDRIIFVNDVFWCPGDMLRLLKHDADMACGLDYYNPDGGGFKFYDTWVGRDADGNLTFRDFPHFGHPEDAARFTEGLPLAVRCCWNGAAVLDAQPFMRGLRQRSHKPGECRKSECSYVCDDLIRLGHATIVVDPMVQLAYNFADAVALHQPQATGIKETNWADVTSAPPISTARFRLTPDPKELCCDSDGVVLDWNTGCHHQDDFAMRVSRHSESSGLTIEV